MRMIIIDNKRVPAPPPPNLDWETALNPVIPTSSARDEMKYLDKWLEIKQEEQMEEALGEVPEVQDMFLEFALGSTEAEAMEIEPPVNENGSHGLNEVPTLPLFLPEYAPPAETFNASFDKPTSTGGEAEEKLLAETADWLRRSVADKTDEEAMEFLSSILYGSSAETAQLQESKCDEANAEDDSSLTNGFLQPPPPKRSRRAKKREPVASTSNQAPGSTDLPFTFRRVDRIGLVHFAGLEDIYFDFVGDCFQCKVCGADFDTESFLKTHKDLCNGKPRRQETFVCSACKTKSGTVRLYLSHFATEKHRSRCPCSKQLPIKNKKK